MRLSFFPLVHSIQSQSNPAGMEKRMIETPTYPQLARHPRMVTLRTRIWIEEPRFQGWGCCGCAWTFNPSGPPTGNSLQEMREKYERLRDKDFAAHVCAAHPKANKARV
jgi:hypothetical protein